MDNEPVERKRAAAILGIGTAVPAYRLDQHEVSGRLSDALRDNLDSMRWAKRIFKQCGVDTRYTCEADLLEPAEQCRYFPTGPKDGVPATRERMEKYKQASIPLAFEAAVRALEDSHTQPSEITHLITVSCTGQFLPGLDAALTVRLGLSPHLQRIPLQFLGCAAGLRAVCLSKQLVYDLPGIKVLVVCVELCTLHIQPSGTREALFGASFFGDGASACVIGLPETRHRRLFELGEEHTALLPDSADEMVWEVGNTGFDLYLSPNIPKLLGRFLPQELSLLLRDGVLPELWAIHPGGRGIIDTLQELFRLSEEQTRPSRSTLRDYGNMSSATLLFVLDAIRREQEASAQGSERRSGVALAFGPGVTAEMIRLTYCPAGSLTEAGALEKAHV